VVRPRVDPRDRRLERVLPRLQVPPRLIEPVPLVVHRARGLGGPLLRDRDRLPLRGELDLPLPDALLPAPHRLEAFRDLRLDGRVRGRDRGGIELLLPPAEGALSVLQVLPGREDPLRLRELLLRPHQPRFEGPHPVRRLRRLRLAGLEVRDHLREARLPRCGLRLPDLERPQLREEVRPLPCERVSLRGELVPLPREALPLPVERRLRGLQRLLLHAHLGELDLEELPLPAQGGLLERFDVLPVSGEVRLPTAELFLLPRE